MRRRLRDCPVTPKLEKVRYRSSEEPSACTKKAKRVRFEDTGTDDGPVHVSTREHEASHSLASDAPKTSEYAYFKNVKNRAVRGNAHSIHKGNTLLNRSKIDDSLRENVYSSEMLKPSTKALRLSYSVGGEGPYDQHLFLSPHASEYNERNLTKKLTKKTGKDQLLIVHDVTPPGKCPSSSLHHEMPLISENQHIEKGTFAAKRHRLCQWAAQTLFPDVENPHPKGSDLVSSLLSRLFPKGNENDDLLKRDIDDTKSPVNKPNNLSEGLYLTHKRDWEEDQSLFSGRLGDILSLDSNKPAFRFPFTSYDIESYAQDKSRERDQHLSSQMHRISDTWHDFSVSSPPERYGSSGHFYFRGLDRFDSVIEHSREEPRRLLLEWDFLKEKEHLHSTDINHDTAKTLVPRLTTSWNVDQQGIHDIFLSTQELLSRSPSLLSNHCLQFDSLQNDDSTDLLTWDYGPKFEDAKCATAELGQFSLALPHTQKCITLAEDMLSSSNFIFSHGDQYWPVNKVWNGIHQDDFTLKCLSAQKFHAEISPISHSWQLPQSRNSFYSARGLKQGLGGLLDPFCEGTFNNSFLPSNLNSLFDPHKNWPLLANHDSHGKP